MNTKIISIAGLSGALAVVLGAFGAHGLKPLLTPEAVQTFETAVRYHFIHSIMAIIAGSLYQQNPDKKLNTAAYLFFAGIVFFSGSLYLLSTRTILGIEAWHWLGPVTPLGGLCFIGGWLLLAWSYMKKGQL